MGAWLGFVAGALVYVYGYENRHVEEDYASELTATTGLALLAWTLLQVLAAFVIAKPHAVFLPVAAVLLAIPAGEYPGGWPEYPVALGVFYFELLATPLVVLGAVAGARRRRGRARGRDGSGPAAWT
jgi:hypothetical protein